MVVYRDSAVVLRVGKLGEADRIVTLLSRRSGRIRAVAKGVRRTRSRFGGRLEPFNHVDVQLYAGRTLDTVTQAVTVDPFGARIASDYGRYTAATVIVETADRLASEERQPWLRLYLLVVSALRALAEPITSTRFDAGRSAGALLVEGALHVDDARQLYRMPQLDDTPFFRDPSLVMDAFLLRAMSLAGWEPALRDCARCAAPGPHAAFHVPSGGALCASCRGGGFARPAASTLTLMEALATGDWSCAEASSAENRREASGLVAALVQFHLERGLRSLPLVDRPLGMTSSLSLLVPPLLLPTIAAGQ
ncbi:MAG: DNA repair protein RecO [Nakamurella sp.]